MIRLQPAAISSRVGLCARALMAVGCLSLLAACGGSGGAPPAEGEPLVLAPAGNISFVSAFVDIENADGFTIPLTVELEAETKKHNVGIFMEFVPFDSATMNLADLDPTSPTYEDLLPETVGGFFIDIVLPGTVERQEPIEVPESIPAREYAIVLAINRIDPHAEDDHLQRETPEQMADNFFICPETVIVIQPDLTDLQFVVGPPQQIQQNVLDLDAQEILIDPFFDDPVVVFPVDVVVEALNKSVKVPVDVAFDVRIPGEEWLIAACLKENPLGGEPIPSLDLLFRVDPETGCSFEVESGTTEEVVEFQTTNERCEAILLLIPTVLWDDRVALDEDFVVEVRCTLDYFDNIPEWGEEPGFIYEDNVKISTIVVIPPKGDMIDEENIPDDWLDGVPVPVSALHEPSEDNVISATDLYSRWQVGPSPIDPYFSRSAWKQECYGSADFNAWYFVNMLYATHPARTFFPGESYESWVGSRPHLAKFAGQGTLTVTLFGNALTMIDVRGGAMADGCAPILSAGFGLQILGQQVVSDFRTLSIADLPSYSASRTVSKEKTIEKTFIVWLFPLNIQAGITGELGISAEAGLEGGGAITLHGEVGPSASLSAFGSAELDVYLARAGITANLTVIEMDFKGDANLTVPLCTDTINGSLTLNVPWSVNTMSGEIRIFAELGANLPWVGRIVLKRWSHPIVTVDGKTWSGDLLSVELPFGD